MKTFKGYTTTRYLKGTNLTTQQPLNPTQVNAYFRDMINDITNIVEGWLDNPTIYENTIKGLLDNNKIQGYPAQEAGRVLGVGDSKDMPKRYPQPYRSLKMARDNYIITLRSYLNRLEHSTGLPTIAPYLRYSACDKQVTQTYHVKGEKTFLWKVLGECNDWWELVFVLPVRLRGADKICQPKIIINENTNTLTYEISALTNVPIRKPRTYLGVDIGRVRPFVGNVIDSAGVVVDVVEGSEQLLNTNRKRLAILEQLQHCYAKLDQYRKLGLIDKAAILEADIRKQRTALQHKTDTISKDTGVEIARHAQKHNSMIGVENLRWLQHRGGKWQHSITLHWVRQKGNEHNALVVEVNAAHTSSTCPQCRNTNTHKTGRVLKCRDCLNTVDRDDAASLEVARRTRDKHSPTPKRSKAVKHTKQPPPQAKNRVPDGVTCSIKHDGLTQGKDDTGAKVKVRNPKSGNNSNFN